MTALTTMRSLVITQIPAANDLLIDRVIVEAAREFCSQSRVLRGNVTATVTADTLAVTLTPPTDTELLDVVGATLDDIPLERKSISQLDVIDPKWRTQAGSSSFITLSDTINDVLIAPMSGTTYASGLVVRGSWRPVLGATTLDDRLVSDWSDALLAGAYARLYGIPQQSWSSPQMSDYYQGKFAAKTEEATREATDSNMKGVVRKVKYGGL